MTLQKQLTQILPLGLIIAGLVGYNFMNAQSSWTGPTAVAPGDNTDTPINIGGDYQAKIGDLGAIRMRSGEYCDAAGQNCFRATDISTTTGVWGTWAPRNLAGNSSWQKNNNRTGIMVTYQGDRDNTVAYVSPTGSNVNEVQVTYDDRASGGKMTGSFMVPPGHFYRFTYGATASVLVLPF